MKKKFEKLSTKEQRIRIIEDTISQILAKKFIATNGNYFSLKGNYLYGEGLKEVMQKDSIECEVCGIGGIFGACVLNVNEISTTGAISNRSLQIHKLEKWFSQEELLIIECAFELGVVGQSTDEECLFIDSTYDEEEVEELICGVREDAIKQLHEGGHLLKPEVVKAIKFGMKYKGPTNRYLKILRNMLKNDGYFRP